MDAPRRYTKCGLVMGDRGHRIHLVSLSRASFLQRFVEGSIFILKKCVRVRCAEFRGLFKMKCETLGG